MNHNDDCATRNVDLGDGHELNIKEFTLLQDDAGAVVWDAGLVLSYYLAHQHGKGSCMVSGRICLELGSGTGVVGLAAGRLGAAQVYLTDLPHLVPYIRENIQLNGLGATCSALPLEWGNAEHLRSLLATALMNRPPDLVMASDVVYTAATRAAFFQSLSAVMAPPTPAPQTSTAAAPAPMRPSTGVTPLMVQPPSCTRGPSTTGPSCASISPVSGGSGGCGLPTEDPEREAIPGGDRAGAGNGDGLGADGERGAEVAGGERGAEAAGGERGVEAADDDGLGAGGERGAEVAGTVALLCYEQRPGVEELPALLERFGLLAEKVPAAELHPDWRSDDIYLLRLRRQPC